MGKKKDKIKKMIAVSIDPDLHLWMKENIHYFTGNISGYFESKVIEISMSVNLTGSVNKNG